MKRTFTVIEVSTVHGVVKGRENLGGLYKSPTPISAAKKAASKICSMSKIKGQCTLFVTVQEITQGSAHKTYRYKVKRVKHKTTIIKDGIPITYHYMTHATSAPLSVSKTGLKK
jgi:hypothetical protein